jgi:hypothetical protein
VASAFFGVAHAVTLRAKPASRPSERVLAAFWNREWSSFMVLFKAVGERGGGTGRGGGQSWVGLVGTEVVPQTATCVWRGHCWGAGGVGRGP